MSSLEELTCTHCGAALTGEAAPGETIFCAHCGTPFQVPQARRLGGVSLGPGASLKINGNLVGGDNITTGARGGQTTPPTQADEVNTRVGGIDIGEGARVEISGDVVGGNRIVSGGNVISAGKGAVVNAGGSAEALEKIREKIKADVLEKVKQTQNVSAPTNAPPQPTAIPASPSSSENFFKRLWRRLFG